MNSAFGLFVFPNILTFPHFHRKYIDYLHVMPRHVFWWRGTKISAVFSVYFLSPLCEERRRFCWQQSLLMTRTCWRWSHGSHNCQAGRCGGKLMWCLIVHTAPTRWRGRLVEVVLTSGVMRTGGRYLKHKLYVTSGFGTSFYFGWTEEWYFTAVSGRRLHSVGWWDYSFSK